MYLAIDYRLSGTGWAECTLSDESSSCELTASYLSDALHNLVTAATAVLCGFSQTTFRFDEEPGEYRWIISSPRINEIQIEIREFDQLWGDQPNESGRLLFQTVCLPETFARAVAKAAEKLLEKHGEVGYRDQWAEHPFPAKQLAVLHDQLNQLER
jgi:hypothetical protein